MSVLASHKPETVWKYFEEISNIPRCSKHEEQILSYLKSFADARGFTWKQDKIGNICINKPAQPGRENDSAVVIQGHVDMVCEKNSGTAHDFMTDGIKLRIEDGWLYGTDTTLGADNGIAVAMALAVLDSKEISHGPLEALFTVDEETGLTGAVDLDPSLVEGRTLINIDSEEEGYFYVGCAGGRVLRGTMDQQRIAVPAGFKSWKLTVKGFRGGHSGTDIHKEFGSAIVQAGRIVGELARKGDVYISQVEGGGKHNAIARECSISLLLPQSIEPAALVAELQTDAEVEYRGIESGISYSIEEAGQFSDTLSLKQSKDLILLFAAMPHGVLGMSKDIPGMVETSSNFAYIGTKYGKISVLCSQRSSRKSLRDEASLKNQIIMEAAGMEVTEETAYPAWTPNLESKIAKTCTSLFEEMYSRKSEILSIHAGLECGIIGDKFKDMQMISFGPDIRGAHTPKEKVHIESTARIWNFLVELLAKL
jgi:dipeptidase D